MILYLQLWMICWNQEGHALRTTIPITICCLLDTKAFENKAVDDKLGGVALGLVQGFRTEQGNAERYYPVRPDNWGHLAFL
jgi:hypothetical protein